MKYMYMLIIGFFLSCSTINKKFIDNNTICEYNDSLFTMKPEKLDTNFIKKIRSEGDLIIKDNKYIKVRYFAISDGRISSAIYSKKNGLVRLTSYWQNGNIKYTYIEYSNGDSNIGKETHYNKKGKIVKIIDHNKGYKICWAEAIEIVKKIAKKDIKKYHVYAYNLTKNDLNKFPKSKPIWYVTLDGDEEYEIRPSTKVYWIDGVTGKFIKTTKVYTTYD